MGVYPARSFPVDARRRTALVVSISLLAAAVAVLVASRPAAAAPGDVTPPFNQCPAVGSDTSCGILIVITDGGVNVLADSSQGPFDGIEDTLVGVLNSSSHAVQSLALHSQTDLFGFDGDGPCSFDSSLCHGPTGYEGPGVAFSDVSPDSTAGVVNFTSGVAPGASAWFGLEEALTPSDVQEGSGQSQVTAFEQGVAINDLENTTTCPIGPPVNCATGEFWHTFTDAAVPGLGAPLALTRTYNSMLAGRAGRFGLGWSDSYGWSLDADPSSGVVTVHEGRGAVVQFLPVSGGGFTAATRVFATLSRDAAGTYTLSDTRTLTRSTFDPAGVLTAIVDRNGYTTSLAYAGGALHTVTDPAGRALTFSYNGAGLVAGVSDPLGRTTRYAYDAAGELTSVTDPAGRTTTFAYDGDHRMTAMTDPVGGETTNTYDAQGRVVSQTVPPGRTTTFAYSGDPAGDAGSTTTVTDPLGVATTHAYRDLQLVSLTRGAGGDPSATWTYAYDPFTLGVSAVTDPLGGVSRFTYDRRGDTLTASDPLGRTRTATYNGLGQPIDVTLPSGETITHGYDAAGNIQSTTSAGGGLSSTTTYTYGDAAHPGLLTATTDANGRTWKLGHNDQGDLTSLTDPRGDTRTSSFDTDGEIVTTTSPLGNVTGADPAPFTTTSSYDADGELVRAAGPAGTSTYTYDGNGNLTGQTDPAGRTFAYRWDAANEQVGVTGPGGATSAATFDAAGHQLTTTDANGQTTTRTYDRLDRVSRVTGPLGATAYAYDAAGDLTGVTGPDGVTKSTTYDLAGEPLQTSWSDGSPGVSLHYDAAGRESTMTDGTGTTTQTYDGLGRLASVEDGSGATTAYAYDDAGNITTMTYPDGHKVSYAYDAAGTMTGVTDWTGHTTTFTPDANNRLTAEAYPNGVTATRAYDPAGRLTKITDAGAGGTLAGVAYGRDADGRVTSAATTGSAAPAATTTYTYSAAGALASVNGAAYTTDPAGNLTGTPDGAFSYNASAQLARAALGSSGTATFTYNAAGERATTTLDQGPGCTLCVLGAGAGTLSATGTGSVAAGGPGAVASTDPGAVTATGSARITADPLRVAGGVRTTGNATVQKVAAGPVPGDPLAGTTAPSVAGDPVALAVGSDKHTQAGPGVYSSISVTDNAELTLTPGTYVVTGPVAVTGSGRLHAQGVSLWMACTAWPAPCPAGTHGASLAVSGNARMDLAAPAGGASGPALAADAHDVGGITLSGSGVLTVDGAVHLPAGAVSAAGNTRLTVSGGVLVAATVAVEGSSAIAVDTGAGQAPAGTATTTYAWNGAGQLTGVRGPGTSATYRYDGDGLRTNASTNGHDQHFVYDKVASGVPKVLTDGDFDYVYGPGGLPVEQVSTADGTVSYLHQDQLGSTVLATDATGATAGTWTYAAYGSLVGHTGVGTALGFTGGYTDATGLVYLVDRYYDPATGQFLSTDPAAGATGDAYGYGSGDPVNHVDPLGTQALPAYCTMALVTCLPTTVRFPTPSAAEAFVYATRGGLALHKYFQTPCGSRFVDVYNGDIIEVKTGAQSASGFILNQVAKDAALVAAGGGISTGGVFAPVGSAEWDFFPNGAGVTMPSVPLLDALGQAGIPSVVYLYQSPQPVPVPVPVPVTVPDTDPVEVPQPAPSSSVWGWVLGGAVVVGFGACVVLTDGGCLAAAPAVLAP